MKLPSQLRVNVITSLGSTVVSTLLMCIAYPVYLHFLAFEQYGLWVLLATVMTMAQLGNFGVSSALVKLISEDFTKGDIEGVYQYVNCGVAWLSASGAVLGCAVLMLRHAIVALFGLGGANADLAFSLLPYVYTISLYSLVADALSSAVAGLGRYDLVSYSQVTSQMLTVVISVVLLNWHFGIWSLVIGNAAGPLLLSLWSLIVIRRVTRSVSLLRLTWDRRRLRRVLNFGSPIFGATIIHTLLISMNKVFVARFAGTAAVPLYEISFVTSFKIRSLFESGFRSLAPEFSRLHVLAPTNVHRSLTAIERKSSTVLRYGGTLVFLTAFLFARFGMKLWLGDRFAPELPTVFRVMLAGVFVSLWNVQPWYTLLGFGRNTQLLFAASVMALTNVGFVLAWPRLVNQAPTLMTVVIGTSLGFLMCTVYLLGEAAKLRSELAAKVPRVAIRRPLFPSAS